MKRIRIILFVAFVLLVALFLSGCDKEDRTNNVNGQSVDIVECDYGSLEIQKAFFDRLKITLPYEYDNAEIYFGESKIESHMSNEEDEEFSLFYQIY